MKQWKMQSEFRHSLFSGGKFSISIATTKTEIYRYGWEELIHHLYIVN